MELARRKLASDRDLKATNLLKGPKGLHARLFFEVDKQELLKNEYDEVRPMWLNTMVELRNLQQLQERLMDVFKTRAERVVFVKGDPDLDFQTVAHAIDIAKGANMDKVGLMTPKAEAGQ